MNAPALLSELRAAGVTLEADGDRLKVQAAPGIITPELTARLRAAKPDLLAILSSAKAPADDGELSQDLPLLAALDEFDALIERLCDLRRYDDATRNTMRATRLRMSPDAVRAELPRMRKFVAGPTK